MLAHRPRQLQRQALVVGDELGEQRVHFAERGVLLALGEQRAEVGDRAVDIDLV